MTRHTRRKHGGTFGIRGNWRTYQPNFDSAYTRSGNDNNSTFRRRTSYGMKKRRNNEDIVFDTLRCRENPGQPECRNLQGISRKVKRGNESENYSNYEARIIMPSMLRSHVERNQPLRKEGFLKRAKSYTSDIEITPLQVARSRHSSTSRASDRRSKRQDPRSSELGIVGNPITSFKRRTSRRTSPK